MRYKRKKTSKQSFSNAVAVDKRLLAVMICAVLCSFASLLIVIYNTRSTGEQQVAASAQGDALPTAEQPTPTPALPEAEQLSPADGAQSALPGKKWAGLKWACVGDSLTENNHKADKRYYDYVAEWTGIEVVVLGRSSTGYKKGDNFPEHAFYQRIYSVPADSDVVTIFGSFNDLSSGAALGSITDVDTDTICGCINTTIDTLLEAMPTVRLGIVTPTPWDTANPVNERTDDEDYVQALIDICARRSIPCLDLYHCSNLRPWDEDFRELCYTRDSGLGTHPDEHGHELIAPRFEAFLDTLLPH